MKALYLFFLFSFFSITTFAQKHISGIVTSESDGAPVGYLSVVEVGANNGTYTNDDGTFSLEVTDTASAIEFSFIGFQTQIVSLENKTFLTVIMKQDAVQLSTIVISVPYGTQTKETFTGAMSVVPSEQFASTHEASFDRVLQGVVPGVQLTGASGLPGSAAEIQLRGVGSIAAGNQPLIVIDGVPVFSGQCTQATASPGILSTINPSDIDNISVLKDASATSLYGSRASNGVILITTKAGKKGKQSYSFSTTQGLGYVVANNFSLLSAAQYKDLQAEAMRNAGMNETDIVFAQQADTASVSWFDEVFRPAYYQNYEFIANGGNEQSRYYISTSYKNEEGIVKNTDLTRFSLRLSVDNTVSKKLSYGLRLSPSYTTQNLTEEPGVLSSPVTSVFLAPPTTAVLRGNEYNFSNNFYNPVGSIHLNQNSANTTRILANAYVDYEILKNLTFKTIAQIDNISIDEYIYRHPLTPDGSLVAGIGELFANKRTTLTSSSTLRYLRSYANVHNFEILGGFETESAVQNSSNMKASNMPFSGVNSLHAASKLEQINSYSQEEALLSFLTNAQYNYKAKYYASASYRTDGSSKFSPNNRWGHFWSLGGSWIISHENFMQDFTKISFLKLRVSYGTSGNSDIRNYAYMNLYGFGNNYLDLPGTSPLQKGNDDLSWEKNKNINIGLDIEFLSRFTASVGLYHRKTYDLLLDVPISMTSGYSSQIQNVGALINKGFEVSAEAKIIEKTAFSWSSTLTFAANKNIIDELYTPGKQDTIVQGTKIRTEGKPLQSFYLPYWAGVNSADGSPMWYDANGNLTRDYNKAAYVIPGSADPKFTLGLLQNIRYKQFRFNAFVYVNYGNLIFNQLATDLISDGAIMGKNQSAAQLDRWQKPGDISLHPKVIQNNAAHGNEFSTRYLEDGSYIRLKYINVEYIIPPTFLQQRAISQCVLTFQISNVWVWSHFSGMDPETRSNGVYYYDYPKQRLYTLGVKINF